MNDKKVKQLTATMENILVVWREDPTRHNTPKPKPNPEQGPNSLQL